MGVGFIVPTNNVRLLTGIPFNKDYENTLYFNDRTTQYNYFVSKTKYINGLPVAWADISYQRYLRNSLKLEINAEAIYDCNYMMFQNSNFGDRWFYAFITNVEYIANKVCRIDYEIDEIQTWFQDCTLHASFVEREHIAVDVVGNNRVEEGIDYGEYYLRSLSQSGSTDKSVIVVAVDKLPESIPQMLYYVYRGIGSGLYYWIYDESEQGVISVNDLIDRYVRGRFSGCNKDDIIAIFQTPKVMWVDYNASPTSGQTDSYLNNRFMTTQAWVNYPFTFDHDMMLPTDINNYTPRNKKLLQYPYNFLYVTDGRSASATYNYEDFVPVTVGNRDYVRFKYVMQGSCDSSMMIIPQNYKGISGDNINEKMVYKGCPQNSWSTSLWESYLAQNGGIIPVLSADYVTPTVDVMTSVANNSLKFDTTRAKLDEALLGRKHISADTYERERMGREGNLTSSSVVARTIAYMGSNIAKRLMGNQAKGNYNGDIIYGAGMHDFYFGQMSITLEFAQRLDEFFDLYGYKTNRVKVPNISSRAHWNYIKTVGLNMEADIPEESAKAIIDIFENGIRFWKDPTDKCIYTQSLANANVGY